MTKTIKNNNKSFYDLSPHNFITSVAEYTGLNSCCDIEIIIKHIEFSHKKTIIDMGAGEGRVIEYLLDKFPGKIFGIEHSKTKYRFLKKKFQDLGSVELINDDICNLKGKFDYGIFSWSVFIEFTKQEQRKLIAQLAENINEKFFIDVPKFGAVQNFHHLENKIFTFSKEWGSLSGYILTKEELESLVHNSSFYLEQCISYETSSGREREIYVISRLNNA